MRQRTTAPGGLDIGQQAGRPRHLLPLAVYSHSMVPGGFEVMS